MTTKDLFVSEQIMQGNMLSSQQPDVLQSAATFPHEQQQQQAVYGQVAAAAAAQAAANKQDGSNRGGLNDLLGLESELSK